MCLNLLEYYAMLLRRRRFYLNENRDNSAPDASGPAARAWYFLVPIEILRRPRRTSLQRSLE
jgi:hypothetical protein